VTGLGTELVLLPQRIDMCLERKSILQPKVEIRREPLDISIKSVKDLCRIKKVFKNKSGGGLSVDRWSPYMCYMAIVFLIQYQ